MKYLLSILLLTTSTFIFSQTGRITGKVRDLQGEAVVGATVFVKTTQLYGASSDENGKFVLELPVGVYNLICRMDGMNTDTIQINVTENGIIELDIPMEEISTILDVVEVKVGKFDKPLEDQTVSMEILKPRLIESKNTRSIETALDQTPGLNILDGEPQIRGGSGFTFGVGSKVAVLVDDMPMLSGDAGRPEWGFIPVENISQVEVIKGAASVLSGSSALSGSINIRTAYPTAKPLTKVILYSGLYSTPSMQGSKWYDDTPLIAGATFLHSRKHKQWDIVLGGNFNYDHGYMGPPVVRDSMVFADTITNFTNRQMVSKRARINFNLSRRAPKIKGLVYGINGNFMVSESNMVFAWLDDTSGIFSAYPGAVFLQKQLIFNIDPYILYSTKNGSKHSLRTRMFRTANDITADQDNQATVLYADYQYKTIIKQISKVEFIGGITAQNTYSYAQIYRASGNDATNKLVNISAYAQAEKKFWNRLTLSVGGRLEYFQLNDSITALKPIFRAGSNFKIHKATFLRASYGQGYRFPTITERYIKTGVGNFGVFPNPEIKAETSWNAEFGIKQGFKIGPVMSFVDVAGFWQEYENTIEYMFGIWQPIGGGNPLSSSAGFMFLNTGKSRVKGIDASLAGTIAVGKKGDLTFLAGYTYIVPTTLTPDYLYATDSLNRKFTYNTTSLDTTSRILKYRFLHNVKVDMEYTFAKKLSIGFSAKYYSKIVNMDAIIKDFEKLTQDIDELQDLRYMDYYNSNRHGNWIFDARISYLLKDKHRFAIIGSNILNKTYSLRPLKIEQPRTVMLQYTLKLGGD
ncbi:TonB-dependent receptor [Fluviicola taffensis]|uniref:TonB-dependent receptor plug n=1 Tax=Fluviicola taffensis (strain DSM 16823 / NCIMB 13979 / RW262) TaxID=755732 RepID=F2IEF8_FLUTR|nr:TonB-dependent receptor [Fluviicola taffensis]AEA43482.1 TonB-dependent receptor plug [Fluviicola taffensis DSM 16823]